MNKATLLVEVDCASGKRRVFLLKFARKTFPLRKNLIDERAHLSDTDVLPITSPESPEPDYAEELDALVGVGSASTQEPRPGPSHRKD